MSNRIVRFGLFGLVIFVSGQSFSAMISPDDDSFVGRPVVEANDHTPHEVFPLMTMPDDLPAPIRSEPNNYQGDRRWLDLRAKILNDFTNRMSADFKVPEGLRQRTEFWFDIYTRYGEAHHIIHHVRYPWIVYKIVDTNDMLLNGKGPLWLRRDRGNKLAIKTAAQVREALRKLARRNDYSNLPALEKELYDKLLPLKGARKAVFRLAAESVRSQLGQKDFFQRGLINSSRYLPYMEEEFRRLGLPTELTRMPFVESSFNEAAYSKVGASGIWQIMPRTGKAYMIVEPHLDERNSPLKATVAAGRLLRSYYRAMNSWPLTITSYNHGIGNIQTAIRKANSRDLSEIVARYHAGDFRFASSNFFTCFLAALYAEKYHELIFKNVPRQPLQEREVIKLSGRTNARLIMKITGLSQNEILKYNLDLRTTFKSNGSVPKGFQLHLPPGYKDRLTRQIGAGEKSRSTRG